MKNTLKRILISLVAIILIANPIVVFSENEDCVSGNALTGNNLNVDTDISG